MPQHRIGRACDLRRSTSPEKIVWELLRAARMDGIKFRRQNPIGPYFADFACVSRRPRSHMDRCKSVPGRRPMTHLN